MSKHEIVMVVNCGIYEDISNYILISMTNIYVHNCLLKILMANPLNISDHL